MGFTAFLLSSSLFFASISCTKLFLLPRQLDCANSLDCGPDSTPEDCLESVCAVCGPEVGIIQECCKAADLESMYLCVQQAMQEIGNGIETIKGTTSSGPDMSIAAATATATTPSSATTYDPCSAVQSSIEYCDLQTPGFTTISDLASQASCLCYRYQSFDAAAFDVPFASCVSMLQANGTLQKRDLAPRAASASITAPCSAVGEVMRHSTTSNQVTATVTMTTSGTIKISWEACQIGLTIVLAALLL